MGLRGRGREAGAPRAPLDAGIHLTMATTTDSLQLIAGVQYRPQRTSGPLTNFWLRIPGPRLAHLTGTTTPASPTKAQYIALLPYPVAILRLHLSSTTVSNPVASLKSTMRTSSKDNTMPRLSANSNRKVCHRRLPVPPRPPSSQLHLSNRKILQETTKSNNHNTSCFLLLPPLRVLLHPHVRPRLHAPCFTARTLRSSAHRLTAHGARRRKRKRITRKVRARGLQQVAVRHMPYGFARHA